MNSIEAKKRNIKICTLYKQGYKQKQIAPMFNLTRESIRLILKKNGIKYGPKSYTKEDLLKRLKEIAKKLGRTPTVNEIKKPNYQTYNYHFGSYVTALKLAGMKSVKRGHPGYTDEYLLARLKELAKKLGHTPTSRDMLLHKPDPMTYKYHFKTFGNAQKLAGLKPNKVGGQLVCTDEYLLNLLKIEAKKLGRAPTVKEVPFKVWLYYSRFGDLLNALKLAGIKSNKTRKSYKKKIKD